jgi:hypothetical protein
MAQGGISRVGGSGVAEVEGALDECVYGCCGCNDVESFAGVEVEGCGKLVEIGLEGFVA